MLTTIRQGIISGRTILSAPAFLQKNGNVVDLICSPGEPILVTLAHKTANYLIEEILTINGAWGSGIDADTDVDINNNPLSDSTTKYLYWDISLRTGKVAYGWTSIAPYVSGTAPDAPEDDTHWFDTVNTVMKVFRKPSSSVTGKWIEKARVFAGTWTAGGGAVLSPLSVPNLPPPGFYGSQVGINGEFQSGTIIFGVDQKPIKAGDNTFLTTATPLIINKTGGQNVRFDATVTYGMASESIPAFSLVSVNPNKYISLSSNSNTSVFISGIVVEDLYENEIGYVVTNGYVRNTNWTWTSDDVGKPVFCGPTGQVTLTAPTSGVSQQVGFVWDIDSIFLNIFAPVVLSTTPITSAPLVLRSDGVLAKAGVGSILSGINGITSNTAFTLNGRGLLYSNGESTNGSVGITFQNVYDRDVEVAGGEASIVMAAGKHFTFRNPLNNTTWFSIDADTGDVYFGGNVQIGGGAQLASAIDHIIVSPNAQSTVAIIIEPDLGVSPTVDLFQIKNTFGGPNVLSVSANGTLSTSNISVGGNISITGTVDGVDISALQTAVNNHISGVSDKHSASSITISPITSLPSVSNVQTALEALAQDVADGFGSVVSAYEHVQNTPNITWIVNHNTSNRRAQVQIWTLDWKVVIPDSIVAIDDNNIAVTFSTPKTGRAVVTTLTPSSGSGGSSGGVLDGNKGDITVSSSGTVWDINANVVENNHLVQVASNTLKGRYSSGLGIVEDLTPNQVRLMLNVSNGATANSTDAQLRDRSTHTGAQSASTISDLAEAVRDIMGVALVAGSGIGISVNDGADTITISSTGSGSGISDGDKGDITVSSSGSSWIIDNGVVSNSKLSTVASSTLKGRITAGSGIVEDLTASQVRTLLNVADGSTANSSDSALRDRSTHTGTQTASTISDLVETIYDEVGNVLVGGDGINISSDDDNDTVTIAIDPSIFMFALPIVFGDETTPITTGIKYRFHLPMKMNVTSVRASLTTPQDSGPELTVDILAYSTSIFDYPIVFDNGSTTSINWAPQPTLTNNIISDDTLLSVNVTQVGSGEATGLKIFLVGYCVPYMPV